ncbi:AAA family ATPase [[Empedobacter] haloabium]|uniref:AAA family ATPase n=1 Tax=[Empedobacter] haloabium TaxID=592317 RepID=A0ABZ1UM63_9BURK
MSSSYFFCQAEKNEQNSAFLDSLENYADQFKRQVFVIDRPLGDTKYNYDFKDGFVLLIPDFKITFLNFGGDPDDFSDYFADFVEDVGSISDKFRYKSLIGRPREWKDRLLHIQEYSLELDDVAKFLEPIKITDGMEKKRVELLISLLTGSINDIEKVKGDLPNNILDKVKQKILLFDGDQTRFVYQKLDKSPITIQGLSGTGKTELLLHKLKELYVSQQNSRIMFTCHNHVLSDTLRKRIPDFFTFMKVEEQIKWEERLWCVSAWGSQNNENSGAYSFITNFYEISFHRFSGSMTFARACQIALTEIESSSNKGSFAFDYMLVDESQDFPSEFLQLCQKVTKNTVYIAGDIFQSIFDSEKIDEISSDFLLSKCYRTDPRTLMFSHALGMGLFEAKKLNWLEDSEWANCGYIVNRPAPGVLQLTREPLRRFEDIDPAKLSSVELVSLQKDEEVESAVMSILRSIRAENPTVLADDIGIVFLGTGKRVYAIADFLAFHIPREFDWQVNKAYETKQKLKDAIFITNKNNVKGLEFPFVICVSEYIGDSYTQRNSLYMTMTRSFIKSYLILSSELNVELLPILRRGLKTIEDNGAMLIKEPSPPEKERIRTTIAGAKKNVSFYDFVYGIFEELGIPAAYRKQVFDATRIMLNEVFDHETVSDTVRYTYNRITGVKM